VASPQRARSRGSAQDSARFGPLWALAVHLSKQMASPAGPAGPARANEFAATTTRSPPAWTRRPGRVRRPRRRCVRYRNGGAGLAMAVETAATTSQSPPAWTRRPGRVRRPELRRVRYPARTAGRAMANEFAATTTRSPPAWTRRPGRVRRPELRRVRYRNTPTAPSRVATPGTRGHSPRRRTLRFPGANSFAPADGTLPNQARNEHHSLLARTRRPDRLPRPAVPAVPAEIRQLRIPATTHRSGKFASPLSRAVCGCGAGGEGSARSATP
jgi:hypothetical protein